MKQICDPEILRQALVAANQFQFVITIQGEFQKQQDGVILPTCEITLIDGIADVDKNAVLATFATQVARDWRTLVLGETARTTAIDQTITQDNVIQQIKTMTNTEYDAWWAANVTNAAQAIGILKRVVRVMCRRLL